jgi:hypothetical protein
MPDFRKMTLESLRELARRTLGPGHARKSKAELVAALEAAGPKRAAPARGGRDASARARKAGGKAGKGEAAGKAPRPGRRAAEDAGAAKPGARAGKTAREAGKAAPRKTVKVKAKPAAKPRVRPVSRPAEGPDPEGYFVARVRGEDAMRESPHPMAEAAGDGWTEGEEAAGAPRYDEHLGDLPWGYGDDAFVALPRDPRTLFLYWDFSQDTLARGFEGFDRPRTQLWVFALGDGAWERVRVLEFALEARGFYVHDLPPGRTYRAEIHVVDRAGRERLLASASTACALPPAGPSSIVDDRFIRIPWDLALGQLLGPGHGGAPFADEVRAQLARLSDWSRFSGPTWGGSAGGMGGRPFSPTAAPSSPTSPFGGGDR